MGSELKKMYAMGLLDAPAYILLIVKSHGKAGWKWTFTVKDFCQEWAINERTFYRAVSKLKHLNLLEWETKGSITVWCDTDVNQNDTDVKLDDTNDNQSDTDDTKHDTSVITEKPQSVAHSSTQEFSTSLQIYSYSSQINSNTTDTELVCGKLFPQESQDKLLARYNERLKQNGVYQLIWKDEQLTENPKFKSILTALASVPHTSKEQSIKAFLTYAKTTQLKDPYKTLADAILKQWD